MRIAVIVFVLLMTFFAVCYAFGGKNVTDRSNGSKIASAGLIAAAILAAWAL